MSDPRSWILVFLATAVVAILPAATPGAPYREQIPGWIDAQGAAYHQKYVLSCEIALTRLALALTGIQVTEDQILATIPRSGDDPEKAFVCDDLNGGRKYPDGTVHWNNYGTHPPVVVGELNRRWEAAGWGDQFVAQEGRVDDAGLRQMVVQDPKFLGAIVWVIGHPGPEGTRHLVNGRGMVLGEHVRFVEPILSVGGKFRVYDPETGRTSWVADAGAGRDLFSYRVVGLFQR